MMRQRWTVEQLAPYAQLIVWGVLGAATALGGVAGAIIGAHLTRPQEDR